VDNEDAHQFIAVPKHLAELDQSKLAGLPSMSTATPTLVVMLDQLAVAMCE
jgi:hypothetical protein